MNEIHEKRELCDKTYFNIILSSGRFDPYSNSYVATPPAIFQQQYNRAIVENPEDYYITVYRLSVPMGEVPLTLIDITTLIKLNIYSTNYLISIFDSTTNTNIDQFITWRANPFNPSFCYRYSEIINMVNDGFKSILAPLGETNFPFLAFSPASERFTLYGLASLYQVDSTGNLVGSARYKIFVNGPLFNLCFEGINAIFSAGTNKVQILLEDLKLNWMNPPTVFPPAAPLYLYSEQEFNTNENINACKSIQVSSTTLPIKSEFVPTFSADGTRSIVLSGNNVLKDFVPLGVSNDPVRTQIQFINNGPYQLINLYGKIPINRIDITFSWVDKYGTVRPILIPYGQDACLKLAFVRRETQLA